MFSANWAKKRKKRKEEAINFFPTAEIKGGIWELIRKTKKKKKKEERENLTLTTHFSSKVKKTKKKLFENQDKDYIAVLGEFSGGIAVA